MSASQRVRLFTCSFLSEAGYRTAQRPFKVNRVFSQVNETGCCQSASSVRCL